MRRRHSGTVTRYSLGSSGPLVPTHTNGSGSFAGAQAAAVPHLDRPRRRAWNAEDKTLIVLQSLQDNVVVSEIARRHGLKPQQIHAWRRQFREGRLGTSFANGTISVVAANDDQAQLVSAPIEIDCGVATVRVREGADVALVTMIVSALKSMNG